MRSKHILLNMNRTFRAHNGIDRSRCSPLDTQDVHVGAGAVADGQKSVVESTVAELSSAFLKSSPDSVANQDLTPCP